MTKTALIAMVTSTLVAGAIWTTHAEGPADVTPAEFTEKTENNATKAKPPTPTTRHRVPALRTPLPQLLTSPQPTSYAQDALAMLPPDTAAVLWAEDYTSMMDLVGAEALLGHFEAELVQIEDEFAEVGLTLMDFVDPSRVGIDPQKSVALAVIGVDAPTVVLAGRVEDPELLRTTIETFTDSVHGDFRVETMGEAELTVEDRKHPRLGFLVRAGHLYILAADRPGDVMTAAAQIAYQELDQGLTMTEAWEAMIGQVQGGVAWGFVNVPAILAQLQGKLDHQLDDRRQTLASIPEPSPWQLKRIDQLEAEKSFMDAVLGSVQAIGGSLRLDGSHISATLQLALTEGSLLQRLAVNRPQYSALQQGLDHTPTFLLDGSLDAQALRELAQVASATLGLDLSAGLQAVTTFGGLQGDLFDVFNGELGMAFTVRPQDEREVAMPRPPFDFTVTAGVARIDEAEGLMDKLTTLSELSEHLRQNPETGSISINFMSEFSLELALVDGTLVLTSDPSFLERLSGGSRGLAQALEHPDLAQTLDGVNTTFGFLYNFHNPKEFIHQRRWSPLKDEYEPSSARAVLAEELHRLRLQQSALQEAHEEHMQQLDTAVSDTLGSVAVVGWNNGTHFEMTGGLYHNADTVQELLRVLLTNSSEQERAERDHDKALNALWKQQRIVSEKLHALQDHPR